MAKEASSYMSSSGINQNYIQAGQISREIKKEVEAKDWRGKFYTEICDFVEDGIKRKGGSPAFPCNICVDESAAHYTAEIDDQKVIGERALLKVDIGIHIDGYIADTAVTLCYNEDLFELAEATKSALNEALKAVRTGNRTSDVGRVIESYASRRGFVPISNLSGHSLEQYIVHAGTTVPNVWSPSPSTFKQDKAYAIEPFFTTSEGSGIVVESRNENIFGLVARKKTKEQKLNDLLDSIWNTRRTLPFAARWFSQDYSKNELQELLSRLVKMRLIRSYPELVEAKGQPVAQAEHTVAPTAAGFLVLT